MTKDVPLLWTRWLTVLCLFLIGYGLVMVFAPQLMNRTLVGTILYGGNDMFRHAFESMGEPALTFLNVLSGLLGTVTTGWAIQMLWIAHRPFRSGETWAWNALAMSIPAWAALEFCSKLIGGISGVGLFAHLGLLIAFAIPLIATYRRFHLIS